MLFVDNALVNPFYSEVENCE